MAGIPHFKLYGEEDPGVESRIQPKLPLRGWDDLVPDEKSIAWRELINNDWFLDDQSDQILDVILYLTTAFYVLSREKIFTMPACIRNRRQPTRIFALFF